MFYRWADINLYMITDIFIVYNKEEQIKKVRDSYIKESPFFNFINETSKKGKKEAYTLKKYWGARLTPFIICMNKEKAVKAFYSETGKDIIVELINYLNNENIHCSRM